MAELVLDGVTCGFGDVVAVDDVSLTVPDGELLVVVGPSGCGKTTLLRTIAGLERPEAGEVYVDGRRVTDEPARRRDIGFVFQDYALFPHLSVRENLAFDLLMRRDDGSLLGWLPGGIRRAATGDSRVAERVEETAELLGIEDLLDRSVDQLSGGQQQRVALGRAIAADPATFLLDEPLANLDAQLRDRMRTELVRLQRDLGTTTVHVTHDQREAMTMGDRVAVFRDGRLQQVGPPAAIYGRPANLFVARFVGNPPMNLLPGRVTDGGIEVDAAPDLAVPVGVEGDGTPGDSSGEAGPGSAVHVGVRPEHVLVERGDAGEDEPQDDVDVGSNTDNVDGNADDVGSNTSEPGAVPTGPTAAVDLVEFHGADGYLYLRLDEGTEMVARVDAPAPVSEGDRVRVGVDPAGVHVFDRETGLRLPVEGGRPTPDPDDEGAL